jgi:class 3 adenylate cyclase
MPGAGSTVNSNRQSVRLQVRPVVPGAVRNRLLEFTPNTIPNVSEFRFGNLRLPTNAFQRTVRICRRLPQCAVCGVVRHVTVLFIRLLGLDFSKGISELKRVQDIVQMIQRLIYTHDGNFMRFSVDDKGAGILGVFGLPPSHEDDPERGVMCALDICRQVKEEFDVTPGVGVTTGYCFSGLVGGISRCEYTTHGPLVNLAARLMVASKNLDPYLDVATRDAVMLTTSKLQFTALRPIKVKGKEELVEIFVPSVR